MRESSIVDRIKLPHQKRSWSVNRRFLISLGLLVHFLAILVVPLAVPANKPPKIIATIHGWVSPWLNATLFDQPVETIAHNATIAIQVFRIEFDDGAVDWFMHPKPRDFLGRPESLHRELAFAMRLEQEMNTTFDLTSSNVAEPNPMSPTSKALLGGAIRNVARLHSDTGRSPHRIQMWILHHNPITRKQHQEHWKPTDLRTWTASSIGDFDAKGSFVTSGDSNSKSITRIASQWLMDAKQPNFSVSRSEIPILNNQEIMSRLNEPSTWNATELEEIFSTNAGVNSLPTDMHSTRRVR